MYIAKLQNNNRILYVFNSETLDEDVSSGVVVAESVFDKIWQSGKFGDWCYINNEFVFDPEPQIEKS